MLESLRSIFTQIAITFKHDFRLSKCQSWCSEARLARRLALSASSLADWFFPLLSPANSCKAMLVSVSCPNRSRGASTLVAYTIFSRSSKPTKYIHAPAVRDRNKSDAFSSSFHCPKVAYSSNWFTYPSKLPFPLYFSGLRLNFFNSTLRCSLRSQPRGSAPRPRGGVARVDALKSNQRVASSMAVSALTPFSSHFSLKSTSESASLLVAILVPHSVDLTPLPPV